MGKMATRDAYGNALRELVSNNKDSVVRCRDAGLVSGVLIFFISSNFVFNKLKSTPNLFNIFIAEHSLNLINPSTM
jgi:hypothetical protein